MMVRAWRWSAATLLLAAGCVDPSARIATGLERYGLDATQSRCVGERLERDLSVGQLRQLAAAAQAYARGNNTPGQLTAADLLRAAGEIHDLGIPLEHAKAASGCGGV